MSQPANILPDQIIALTRVVQFAKENGFPKASQLLWDDENPEYGATSVEELVEEPNQEYRIRLGLDLGGPPIYAERKWDFDNDADGGEIVFASKAPCEIIGCPHCNSGLLWSEDRGAHCDGCDDFDPESDLPND